MARWSSFSSFFHHQSESRDEVTRGRAQDGRQSEEKKLEK